MYPKNMEKNFQKLEEVFLKNEFISKNLSPFCNIYCDSRYIMLSLTPIFQKNEFAIFSK